jgi:peptidoglycan/xylan/chitin deacetylase (PgdA/CDA1 family)
MDCVIYACHHLALLAPKVEEPGTLRLQSFSRQLQWLKRMGVHFISLRNLAGWLDGKQTVPERSAVLTFDDAYSSVAEHGFPILQQHDIPFCVFVIAGLIGKESTLYAHRGGSPRRHLDTEELRSLIDTGLVEIGVHGYEHRDLTTCDAAQRVREIAEAKQALEDIFQQEMPYFAYPFGRADDAVAEHVQQSGYRLALTTQKRKLISASVDRWRLPRVNWGRRSSVFKLTKYYLWKTYRSAG